MKKIIALLLAVMMMVSLFAACGEITIQIHCQRIPCLAGQKSKTKSPCFFQKFSSFSLIILHFQHHSVSGEMVFLFEHVGRCGCSLEPIASAAQIFCFAETGSQGRFTGNSELAFRLFPADGHNKNGPLAAVVFKQRGSTFPLLLRKRQSGWTPLPEYETFHTFQIPDGGKEVLPHPFRMRRDIVLNGLIADLFGHGVRIE